MHLEHMGFYLKKGKNMTRDQALQIIDNALSQMALSRKDHEILIEALRVLKEKSNGPSDNG